MHLTHRESMQGLPRAISIDPEKLLIAQRDMKVYQWAYALGKAYLILTKPRIVALLLFTAYCTMIVAAGRLPSASQTIIVLFGLALSGGGAAVINMWFDRDIDAVMQRTANRPIPSGVIKPAYALSFGLILGAMAFVWLGCFANWLTAAFSLAGFLYYGVIYTMGLKRRTPQNIVIGGGAGAFPPLVGWAAVTGHLSWLAVALFAVIFLWTPAHFWGLALHKNEDYKRAGIPMMPAVRGVRSTKRQMVAYTLLLLVVSLCLPLLGRMGTGALYEWAAAILGLMFLYANIRLWLEPGDKHTWAIRTFIASLLYLPAIFTVMAIAAII